ncbi:MAG TPA: holo-ACP synthase [Candidatus Obscuribacterales bacterium]
MTDTRLKIKIGTDICSVGRIRKSYERFGERLMQRVLTPAETAYVTSSRHHMLERLAGRFAAKEATVKALGVGWRGVGWKEIEVVRLPSGQPTIKLYGRALALAEKLGLVEFELSMSHEREFATAFVIAYAQI